METMKNRKDKTEQAKVLYNEAIQKISEGEDIEAVNLYEKAAKLGLMQAQYNLALIYLDGTENVKPDMIKAVELFRKAAKQGCEEAEHNLAFLTLPGIGTKQNLRKGYEHLKRSNVASDQEVAEKLKLQTVTYLDQGMSFWKSIENVEIKGTTKEILERPEDLKKIFLAYRTLAEAKARTRNVKDLQIEFQKAESKLIEIVPKLVKVLQNYNSVTNSHKMIYEMATKVATDIQKYEDAYYKSSKDSLAQLRKEAWSQLTPEEKTEVKANLETQKQDKAYIETDPAALKRAYTIG